MADQVPILTGNKNIARKVMSSKHLFTDNFNSPQAGVYRLVKNIRLVLGDWEIRRTRWDFNFMTSGIVLCKKWPLSQIAGEASNPVGCNRAVQAATHAHVSCATVLNYVLRCLDF